jgi:hypothetical protein
MFANLALVSPAGAELHDRGGGLIYDDVLDVTWLQDAAWHVTSNAANVDANGKMLWQDAMNWTSSLVYHDPERNVDWDGWRLPRILPVNGTVYDTSYSCEGLTDNGYNITSPASELSYMYHVNLGGTSLFILVDAKCTADYGAVGIDDSSPFTGIGSGTWSQNEHPDDPARIFMIGMGNGHQDFFEKTTALSPWAVRDGDVAPLVSGSPAPDGAITLGDIEVLSRKIQGLVSFP